MNLKSIQNNPRYIATMSNDPLPTPKQREMLCDMIHYAFVELRLLGAGGHGKQAEDLADAFHNIPQEMYREKVFSWDTFREVLEIYQRKWQGKSPVSGRDYVEMLEEIRRSA